MTAGASIAEDSEPLEQSGASSEVRDRADELKSAMRSILEDGRLMEFFRIRSQLRGYSPFNTVMLMVQRPDAKGLFASKSAWTQMGRTIKDSEAKGALGIWIPNKKHAYKRDERGNVVKGDDGKPVVDRQWMSFKWKRAVYDISQTDGPDWAPPTLKPIAEASPEQVQGVTDQMRSVCEKEGISIHEEELRPGLYGYYNPDSKRLVLSDKLTKEERALTMAHEVSHALDPDLKANQGIYRHTRGDCEAVAEASANVIAARYGIDTSEHSASYVVSWVGSDVERLEKVLSRVDSIVKEALPPSQMETEVDQARDRAKKEYAKKKAEQRAKKKTSSKKRTSRKRAAV